MRAPKLRFACVVALLAACSALHAQTVVPPPLEAWRGWVLKDQEFRSCPLLAGRSGGGAGDFVCAWPGTLALTAGADGADFSQRWRLDADGWIALPGSAAHWPQQVMLDGKPASVLDQRGPALWLTAGTHEVRGHIPWRERPQTLRVPQSSGLVALDVDGKRIAPLQRNGDELTLGRGATTAPEADSLDLRVHRRLADGVPAMLSTQVQLRVAGQAREEILGPVLPAGFVPTALAGNWPARLDGEGRLHVLVQPGTSTLTLNARASTPLERVAARIAPAPWPPQEIWSYAADPAWRVSVANGATAVDPRQNGVPDAWLDLPAFALGADAALTIEQRSRGMAADEGNRLRLQREMWLDFDGGGWFAHDRLSGSMLRGWRFDAAQPWTLERATADADDAALLVTTGAGSGLSGVEWRLPAVDLDAGLRVANSARLPVTGWQDNFDHVATVLHLPNGYRLVAAPGADRADGSWLSLWTLLDVFLAAILVLVAWRGLGMAGGLAALGYLLLGYQEPGAPVWLLLAAIVFAIIARELPGGGHLARAAIWLRRAALAALVLVALPFATAQLRQALHPQLEPSDAPAPAAQGYAYDMPTPTLAEPPHEEAADAVRRKSMAMPLPAPAPATAAAAAATGSMALESVTATGSRIDDSAHTRNDPAAVMQTGSGEPHWQLGHRYELAWDGPVLPSQQVRLVIAPPWLVRPLRVLLTGLLALLVVLILKPKWRGLPGRTTASLLGALAVGLATLLPATPAQAQALPGNELLDQLRARLVEAPRCIPNCALIAQAEVSARGDRVDVALQVNAGARVAVPLPGDDEDLVLRGVRVDGVAQDAFARSGDRLHAALDRGVHRLELSFEASGDKVALAFPLRPQRVRFAGEAWEASGLVDDRLQTDTLSLARARSGDAAPARDAGQQFPPFVRVTRTLRLGMDWTVDTKVERLAPDLGAFTVGVPLLTGEHVTSAGHKVVDGHVTAAFAARERQVEWTSTLAKDASLHLLAPALDSRAERWLVAVGPMWHAQFAGVPQSNSADDADAAKHDFQFQPLPGETLTLTMTRPAAVAGATRAIDAVALTQEFAQRAATTTLTLTLRASQGGEHALTLPAGAEVLGVERDGEPLNLRPQDGKLSLPLTPGSQQFRIRWRDDTPVAGVAATPTVALGLPAANITLEQSLPQDRWLLATSGPPTGPAVLYWSELLVMLLVAFALARLPRSPLKAWQWALLGIGFSTWSWPALLIVVGWLYALDWRARGPLPRSPVAFNFAQVGLALLTVYALACLFDSIRHGLLGAPEMHVAGNGSSEHLLQWFADRSSDLLPVAKAISLPLWSYQLAMLAWSLWLASALVRWLRRGFAAWTQGGYWRQRPKPVRVELPQVEAPPAP